MLEKLKHLLKHSFVYSISNAAIKASGIILLPIYSANLTLAEFGSLGIIEVTIVILVEIINLGQGQVLVMMINNDEYKTQKGEVFFTVFIFSATVCALFLAVAEISLPYLVNLIDNPEVYYTYFRLSIYVIVLRILFNIFMSKIRADERSVLYSTTGVVKLLLMLGLITYFVAFNNYKVEGILYSYIIAESLLLVALLPSMLKQMFPRISKEFIVEAVKFGFPLIFGSISMMMLNVSDRYIIKYFLTDEDVGLYDLGYRIAGTLNMFVIMPFTLTLMPQAYKMFKKEGDVRFYSKVLTYLTLALVWIGLGLSLFSKEIIKTLALNVNYWPAYTIVPIIVLSYVFFGMRIVAALGMYLKKNTRYIALTTTAAFILNIVLNILLIPVYGISAAAYSTLISFLFLYLISLYFGNISYKINFEHFKIFAAIFGGLLFYFVAVIFNGESTGVRISIKLSLLFLFPPILYLTKFFEPIEIQRIKDFIKKFNTKNNS